MQTIEHRALHLAIAQRNAASDQALHIAAQQQDTAERLHEAQMARDAAFVQLDACINSGQVAAEAVPGLIESVPGFDAWRQAHSSAKSR